ncbi:MAG: type IX secretion system membrane protein PorP/SprF [Saprospiraceae bacterium]|nr:type IX secretion system membrane protein PorP/SprF [Saprospiraceae bacterium]MDW8230293.1 type IX secretion system membrane protein PorP/SprF [Saprospiraceae bacterium]
MRRRRYFWFLLLIAPCAAWGQQLPQYSLYMLNPYAYNPAYAGTAGTLLAHGAYRQQWSGLAGAPESQYLDAHVPMAFLRGGAGIRLENDKIGVHRTTRAVLHYAYHLDIGRTGLLSVGVGAGYVQYALDGDKVRTPDGVYEPGGSFTHNDPLFPEGKVVGGAPSVEMGIFFRQQQFELGAALMPAYAPVLSITDQGRFRVRLVPQYVGTGAYRISVSNQLTFVPSFLLKFDPAATQVEISGVFRWRENTFAGSSFRGLASAARDALALFGGFRITEKILFAYSYDIPLSSLANAHRGSHELLIRYDLGKPVGAGRLPPVIYNPRFPGI